tara:strand:- start:3467 stop:4117 length:651 start_codon:yes stop_codon:yes gene_type:complete
MAIEYDSGLKRALSIKTFRKKFVIDTGIINVFDFNFGGLQIPEIDEQVAQRVAETTRDLQNLQTNAKTEDLIESSMRRNEIKKDVFDALVLQGTLIAEQEQLVTQALYDFIMGMIMEGLVLPSGIPRDDWSNNQDYFQHVTNMVMSSIQTNGETSGLQFQNNFMSNMAFYATNSSYYNDFYDSITIPKPNISTNAINSPINTNVYNVKNLIRGIIN